MHVFIGIGFTFHTIPDIACSGGFGSSGISTGVEGKWQQDLSSSHSDCVQYIGVISDPLEYHGISQSPLKKPYPHPWLHW